jgi:hypothetical protein
MLVCADLRDAVTAALLGVGDARGLAEILAGTATVTEVARQSPEVSRLRVITPGVDTTAALTHMQHDASRRLVAELQRDAQYVVIDAQATGDGADTFSLAEFADAALVVLERERTRQAEARDSIRRLDRMHTAVLGAAVLPNIRRRGRGGPAPARREPRPAPAAVPAVPAAPPAPAPPSAARPPAGAVPAYPAQAVPRVTGGPRPPAGRDDADDADPGPVTPESAVPEPAAPEPADLAPADPAPAAGPGEGWAGSGPGWPASGEGHGDDQDHGDPQGSPAAPGRPASANGTTPAGRKPPRGAGETWPLPRVPVSNPATSRQRHPRTGDPADQAGEGG